jgi:hypothetical protein
VEEEIRQGGLSRSAGGGGGGLSREEVCQGGGLSWRSVKVEEVCQGALEVEEEGVSDLEGSEHRAGRAGRKTGGRV